MVSKKQIILIGFCILILAALIVFAYLHASQGSQIDFEEIANYNGSMVNLEGYLGENITLQQSLQNTASVDSGQQYYYLYADETAQDEKIILVFDDSPYIDQNAFVQVTGMVELSDSGTVYLKVSFIR